MTIKNLVEGLPEANGVTVLADIYLDTQGIVIEALDPNGQSHGHEVSVAWEDIVDDLCDETLWSDLDDVEAIEEIAEKLEEIVLVLRGLTAIKTAEIASREG